jgi:hypothetical protein
METQLPDEGLLTRLQAAKYIGGVCLTTLSRLGIPVVRVRRRKFYRRSDLDRWIAKQVIKPEGKSEE